MALRTNPEGSGGGGGRNFVVFSPGLENTRTPLCSFCLSRVMTREKPGHAGKQQRQKHARGNKTHTHTKQTTKRRRLSFQTLWLLSFSFYSAFFGHRVFDFKFRPRFPSLRVAGGRPSEAADVRARHLEASSGLWGSALQLTCTDPCSQHSAQTLRRLSWKGPFFWHFHVGGRVMENNRLVGVEFGEQWFKGKPLSWQWLRCPVDFHGEKRIGNHWAISSKGLKKQTPPTKKGATLGNPFFGWFVFKRGKHGPLGNRGGVP